MYRRSRRRGDFKIPMDISVETRSKVDSSEKTENSDNSSQSRPIPCCKTDLPFDPSQAESVDDPNEMGAVGGKSEDKGDLPVEEPGTDNHSETQLPSSLERSDSMNFRPYQASTSDSTVDDDVLYLGQVDAPNLSGPVEFCKAIAPRNEESSSGFVTAKRIHMESQDCQGHLNTAEGSAPLTHPTTIAKSSKDPHRGMYPRGKVKNSPMKLVHYEPPKGFVKASNLGVALPSSVQNRIESERNKSYSNLEHRSNSNVAPEQRGKKRKLPQQGNTLQNYFTSASPKKERQTDGHMMNGKIMGSPLKPSQSQSQVTVGSTSSQVGGVQEAGPSQTNKTTIAWTVTPPQLPKLEPGSSPRKGPQTSKLKGSLAKRKRTGQAKQTDPKLIGPEAHNIYKATFLYDKQLAKPPKTREAADKYGLLGSGNYPPGAPSTGSYFDRLPYELIENIFCRLPMMDLLLNVNKVCLLWNGIISDEAFLPWKKRYFRVKLEMEEDLREMSELLGEHGMTSAEDFLMQLIRYMKNFKVVTSPDMDTHLQKHHLYDCARAMCEERITDCLTPDKTVNPWCMVTLLVILSEYVKDVQEIYQVLLTPSSEATAYEIVECLYCISTFLLMFKRQYLAASWNGMHYRCYYALYLYENESTTTADQLQNATSHGKGGQQSLHKYSANVNVQMTHEQLRICNHNVTSGQIAKIIAFAGTGKTTTLVKYTRLRPNLRFLLVVYNKSVKLHAQTKFPSNVTCKTGHGLAFGQEGRKFAAKNKLGSSGLKVHNVLKHYKAIKGESLYVQAKFVIDTLNRFMASADPFITTAHVPDSRIDDNGLRRDVDHSQKMHYAAEAEKYWNKMIDFEDSVQGTHDTYLKTYQLRKPKIWGYDVILIDEAQDMTPALADILLSQKEAKILVGDPHQQIYSFRGAVNAMQQVQATHTFYLTQSFRFGSEIAFVASSCLEVLKGEKKKTLVGNASTGSIRGEVSGQMAIITRSNFTLFSQAVTKCCYSECSGRVAFVGGTESFGFETILDIYVLLSRFQPADLKNRFQREIKNPFIAGFPNIGELEKYATKTSDGELLGKIKIVKSFTHALPSLISKIRSQCINDTDLADIVLSTAHKSKGLEFTTVKLTDDYILNMRGNTPNTGSNDDESNILYVAATRAKKHLLLTPDLLKMLKACGENFMYPVPSKDLTAKGKPLVCTETGAEFKPCAATLVRRSVNMPEVPPPVTATPEITDALISPAIVAMEHLPLRQLYGPFPQVSPQNSQTI